MLVERARSEGLQLTGQGGLLRQLTKRVLESALEGEITDHLGYERHDAVGRGSGNSRNGSRAKTVLTDVGPVEVKVPRDTAGSYEPQIVKKRQRRLTGIDEMVLSLSAKGLTHGEISAHLAEVYGAEVSKQTVSTLTDQVMEGMAEWQNRPLDRVYPVLFVDAVNVKIRDGKVANRPIHVGMAVTGTAPATSSASGPAAARAPSTGCTCSRAEEPRLGQRAHAGLRRGLKGLPEAMETVWPRTIVQTCVVHLLRNSFRYATRLRNSFRYAARQDWDQVAGALKPVYSAPSEDAATERFLEFQESWGRKYPAIVKLWSDAWAEFVPFLSFDVEIRKVICSTNAIESANARIRRSVRARGHFPGEAAALKCIYTALMSLDPTGKGRKRWTMRWKAPLNAFQIAFEGRPTPSNN
jgi:transposase-like protein